MSEWSFLTSHGLVLSLISKKARITGLEISQQTGITERAVRKIIADLDSTGYISKQKEGKRIKYRINPNMTLRHQLYQKIVVGDLLEALGWKKRGRNIDSTEEKPKNNKGKAEIKS